MPIRIINILVLISFIFGCNGESSEQAKEQEEQNLAVECISAKTTYSKTLDVNGIGFGDGSDGEFYLSFDDTFHLEAKEYNFTNVNLDRDSLLTIVSELAGSDGTIQINSLGVCNLLGDVNISGYRGTFVLNCNSGIKMEGSYSHLDGSTALTTSDSILISEEFSTNISDSTISAGSIDISGAQLSTVSSNIVAGEVAYSPGVLVTNDVSLIIDGGEISFELVDENGDEDLTNCSI